MKMQKIWKLSLLNVLYTFYIFFTYFVIKIVIISGGEHPRNYLSIRHDQGLQSVDIACMCVVEECTGDLVIHFFSV